MRFFSLPSVLCDRAGTADSGAHSAPYVHSLPNEPEQVTVQPSDTDKRFEELQGQFKALQEENREARENAQYWAKIAKEKGKSEPEPEPDPEAPAARRQARKAPEDEKPEELLDDVSKEGLKALFKRGVITEEELETRLEELADSVFKRVDKRIEAAGAGLEFDQRMGREFPDLVADNARVNSGQKPQSEIFVRSAQHFRQMIEDSGVKPDSAAARGLMYSAAKLAKKELEMEGHNTRRGDEDREEGRRRRIDAQSGDRGGRESGDDDGAPTMSRLQLTMAKNLGVTPAEMAKHVGKR